MVSQPVKDELNDNSKTKKGEIMVQKKTCYFTLYRTSGQRRPQGTIGLMVLLVTAPSSENEKNADVRKGEHRSTCRGSMRKYRVSQRSL